MALARAPLQQRQAGGGQMRGEGLDLRTLATGHAGVEAAVGLGQRARRQGRQRAQLGAAHQRGQVGGEPAQGVVRILHQMLERGLVERAQLGRERRPLGAPGRQAGLEGGRAPQGVVAGEQGLQFEEAVAVVHCGGEGAQAARSGGQRDLGGAGGRATHRVAGCVGRSRSRPSWRWANRVARRVGGDGSRLPALLQRIQPAMGPCRSAGRREPPSFGPIRRPRPR